MCDRFAYVSPGTVNFAPAILGVRSLLIYTKVMETMETNYTRMAKQHQEKITWLGKAAHNRDASIFSYRTAKTKLKAEMAAYQKANLFSSELVQQLTVKKKKDLKSLQKYIKGWDGTANSLKKLINDKDKKIYDLQHVTTKGKILLQMQRRNHEQILKVKNHEVQNKQQEITTLQKCCIAKDVRGIPTSTAMRTLRVTHGQPLGT